MNPWDQLMPEPPSPGAVAPASLFARRKKFIDTRQKRLRIEDGPGGASQGKAGPAWNAATALGVVETVMSGLEHGPLKNRDQILDLAVVEACLEVLCSPEKAASPEFLEQMAGAQARVDKVVSQALTAKMLPKRPLELVREVLPALDEAFEKAKRLMYENLFVPPRLEAEIMKERTELQQKIQTLKDRETQLLEEDKWLDLERQKCGSPGDAAKNPALAARLGELDGKWKALCEKVQELFAEEGRLADSVRGLERKYPARGGVSLLDARRTSLFKAFDPAQISADEVDEKLKLVKALPAALDQKLTELEAKLPPPCRDASGEAVNSRFRILAWVLGQRESVGSFRHLQDREAYVLVYRGGEVYREIKEELVELVSGLEALAAEYQAHLKAVNDIKDLVRQGNVFLAEKRFKALVPKFKEIRYQIVQALIEESLKVHREAQRLVADAAEFQSKSQGFFAKMFRDRNKQNELQQRLTLLQGKAASLPKSELKTTV